MGQNEKYQSILKCPNGRFCHCVKLAKLYGPTSNLGYGVSDSDVKQALKWDPDVIFQQGTSTDPGPGYLGSNDAYSDRAAIKRDLEAILPVAIDNGIPFIFSAGGAGSNKQLVEVLRVVNEIALEQRLHFRAAVIKSEIDPDFVRQKIAGGEKIMRLVEHPALEKQLSRRETDKTIRLVGQMSYEPIIRALEHDIQVVITGRACDIALPMALPLKLGFDKGLTAQVGKIVECGGAACERERMPAGASTGIFAIIG